MSKIIEERVTSMKFDNNLFEKAVNQSLQTIDKLKDALNFQNVGKGLESINISTDSIRNGLGNAVSTVSERFGALDIAAGVALGNIVSNAVSAGMSLVKSFTIDPIISGFNEYETQLNAVQTILANTQSKGSTLQDVNNALDELNEYADLTIYNFTEMTRNIGTFTAAGVDLETSVSAIKGIANLAAVSGSTSQQASTAMYQLSQALAAGKVQLQDWNSVVNAGMGGELFKNALMTTSRIMGTGIDAALEEYGTFRESLTKGGWLTSEVLTETLKQISGAYSEVDLMAQGFSESQAKEIVQLANTATDAATKVKTFTNLMETVDEAVGSGWATTWRIIIGDFEEAKQLWTGISEVVTGFIGKMSDARNLMLLAWKDAGGRTAILNGLKNILTTIYNILKPFTDAMKSIIPKVTGEQLAKVSKLFERLTNYFKVGSETSQKLSNILVFLATPLRLLVDLTTKIIGGLLKLIAYGLKPIVTLGQSVAMIFIKIADAIVNFIRKVKDAIVNSTLVSKALEMITKYVSPVIDTLVTNLSKGYNKIVEVFRGIRDVGRDDIFSFLSIIKKQLEPLSFISDFLKEHIDKLIVVLTPIASELKSRFYELASSIKTSVMEFDYSKIGDYANKFKMEFNEFVAYLKETANVLKERSVFDIVSEYLNEKFGPSIETVSGYVSRAMEILSEAFSKVKGIAIEKFEYLVERFKDASDKLSTVGDHIRDGIKSLVDGMKTAKDNLTDTAIGFQDAIKTVADTIDPEKFMQFIGGSALVGIIWKLKSMFDGFMDLIKGKELNNSIIDVLNGLSDTLEAYQKNIKADRLVKIAGAIAILAGALLLIGQIDSDKLGPAVMAMGAVIAEMAVMLKAFDKLSGNVDLVTTVNAVVALIGISTALLVLSNVFVKMAEIKWDTIAKGSIALFVMASILVSAGNNISRSSGSIKKAAWGLITLATALKLMVGVVDKLGQLDIDVLGKGLVGIGVLLAELGVFLTLSKLDGLGVFDGVGLVLLATSLLILSKAVKSFGEIDIAPLAKGLGSIAALMFILKGIPNMMSTATGIGILAVSLLVLTSAIRKLDGLNPGQIAKGLITILLTLTAISVGMMAMPTSALAKATAIALIITQLNTLAKGITNLGNIDTGALIKGLLTMSIALAVLAVTVSSMTGTISGAVAVVIVSMSLGILADALMKLGSIPLMTIGIGLLALVGTLGSLALLSVALTPALGVLAAMSGILVLLGIGSLGLGAGLLLLSTGLAALAASGVAGFAVLTKGIGGLIALIPDLIVKIGEGLIKAMQLLVDNMPLITELMISAIKGLATAIIASTPVIVGGLMVVIQTLLETLAEHLPEFIDAGTNLIVALLDGISRNMPKIVESAINVMATFMNSLAEKTPELVDAGLNLIFSFCIALIEGLGKKIPEVITAVQEAFGKIVKAGKDTVIESVTGFIDAGAQIISGLVGGIYDGLSTVVTAIGDVASAAIKKGKEIFDINSPSRVFAEMGMYCDKGLAGGVIKHAGVVIGAVKTLGSDTVDTMRNVLSSINFDAISDDGPTIKPILDLSDVDAGMGRINDLFANQRLSLGLAGAYSDNVKSISASNIGIQNDNSDVVSAIYDLKKAIGNNNSGNTYRMGDIVYDDGSNVSNAIETLVRAARVGRRI